MAKTSYSSQNYINMEELRSIITEIINNNMTGYNARVESQFEIINMNLDYIKNETTKTNSRTNLNEDDIAYLKLKVNKDYNDLYNKLRDHAIECPLKGEVVVLKNASIKKDGAKEYAKNFLITLVSALTAITLFYGLYNLIT